MDNSKIVDFAEDITNKLFKERSVKEDELQISKKELTVLLSFVYGAGIGSVKNSS